MLSEWNVPRNDKVEPASITDIKIGQMRYGKDVKFLETSHYDPRAPHQREVDKVALNNCKLQVEKSYPSSLFVLYDPPKAVRRNAAVQNRGDVPATASSSDVPATASSSDVPATASSSDVPATASSSDVPATASSRDVPATASSSDVLATASSSDVPATASSSDVPATASSSDVPATASSSDVPATASSSDVPATASSSDVPATASSSDVLATASSSDVPATASSSDVLATASSSDVPATASSSDVPAITSSSDVPATASWTHVLDTCVVGNHGNVLETGDMVTIGNNDVLDTCAGNPVDILDPSSTSLPFNDFYDFTESAFTEMMDTHLQSLKITKKEQTATEVATRGQSNSDTWKEERKKKLTASNFSSAITCKVEPSNKVRSIMYNTFSTAATQYGNQHEDIAVEEYVKVLQKENPEATCIEAGLILSLERPWLGASVDRLVVSHGQIIGGVEVKCPHSKKGLTLEEAVQNKAFFLKKEDSSAALKRSHKYYHQVQGQIYCYNLDWVDFVVYFGRDNIFCERIKVDAEWQKKNIPKLDHFYKTAILPELFTQRVKRGKKLYGMYGTGKWTPYLS
ncbi:pneumococcal serine-rich repeat protein-like [Branchiostoma floridae]|uniref:Pneumococcal serine-rich repeat protein-like n=1 Tax=Branchiostoma floridae TaxID=7739 RepID=A0A9J7NC05_BRAFL|nr:pneumococcal serine-rich repeat protein-like [Branchiostoma floridae]